MSDETSSDSLLGGRIMFNQFLSGYRAAIDPVLLAASVDAQPGERVLDLGCGSGAACLCLAARLASVSIDGLELNEPMAQLARQNVLANDFQDRLTIIDGDIADPPPAITAEPYDHIMANPPYMPSSAGNQPRDQGKLVATVEGAAGLDIWIDLAWRLLRHKATLTLVHRADRLGDILVGLHKRFGGVVVFPLWPGGGGHHPARRVIVRAIKNSRAPLYLSPGLVLHLDDGEYSSKTQGILRHGDALDLQG